MASGSVDDRAMFKKFEFHYAIFDEGHLLKNMTSVRYQSLMKISVCCFNIIIEYKLLTVILRIAYTLYIHVYCISCLIFLAHLSTLCSG